MPKYLIELTKSFAANYVVEAEDKDHALEIASEAVDEMELNYNTFWDSNWEAHPVDNDEVVTYTPIQEYLK